MFKLFKNFTKKDVFTILISTILIVFQVYLDLKLPDYMSEITKLVQTDGSTIQEILVQGGYMLMCAFGSLVSACIVGFLASNLSANFSYTLRSKVYNKVLNLSTAEIKQFQTSSLITRTTNDITQMEMIVSMGLQMIIKAPIMAVWAILKIISKSIEWSMLTAGCVVILLATVISLMIIVMPRFEKVQKLIDKINNIMRESIMGIRVIRAFNAEEYQENKFNYTNQELTNMQMFNQKCFALLNPVINLVMHALTLGIYIIGVILIDKAIISAKITLFSDMVIFSSYGMEVIMSFLMLAIIFMMWPRAKISANRINEVLDCDISVKEGEFADRTNEVGTVEFKNVSFKYPDADEYLLRNISFKANKGETIAFIGSTGAGKSSLINLIPRFYDATDGEVLVDGVNVKDYTFEALYNKLGYVPQKAVMFTGTVASNVTYGKSYNKKPSDKKLVEALDIAQADFVKNMADGVDSHIARGGTNVSGGQKQRLAIARSIARNPEIYIFDDSFSALDYKTDAKLRKELKEYTKSATSLIVAQRIGTILNADKIIVLDKGHCVGVGTHKELLKTCPIYKEIALSQISKEELENA